MTEEIPAWLKLVVSVLVMTALIALWNALPLRYFVNDDFSCFIPLGCASSGCFPKGTLPFRVFMFFRSFCAPLVRCRSGSGETLDYASFFLSASHLFLSLSGTSAGK